MTHSMLHILSIAVRQNSKTALLFKMTMRQYSQRQCISTYTQSWHTRANPSVCWCTVSFQQHVAAWTEGCILCWLVLHLLATCTVHWSVVCRLIWQIWRTWRGVVSPTWRLCCRLSHIYVWSGAKHLSFANRSCVNYAQPQNMAAVENDTQKRQFLFHYHVKLG